MSGGPPQSAGQTPKRPRESTVYRPVGGLAAEGAPATPSVAKDRKIVGILVTYSWTPEGQVFPVREGRNFIGRDRECEICVPDDNSFRPKQSRHLSPEL